MLGTAGALQSSCTISPMELTQEARRDVEGRVVRAVRRMMVDDAHLLLKDCSEMAVMHRIAVYLEADFYGWHVDVEYNRDGHNPKAAQFDVPDRSLVVPDVLVHGRGTNDRNLVVIEAKKQSQRNTRGEAGGRTLEEEDFDKLRAYRRAPFRYAVIAFLLVRTRLKDTHDPIGATLVFAERAEPVRFEGNDAPPPPRADWFERVM
jgi:hypothetical protein